VARDLIGQLGYLTLGSRFRRLGERLQAGVSQLAAEQGIAIAPAHLPILMALDERPLPVSGLVGRLDIAQPGITRSVAKLLEDGLIEVAPGTKDDDRRQRKLRLSRKGRALLDRAQGELFPAVERAVAEMCAEPAGDLLGYLDRLDDALRAASLDRRARAPVEGAAS
jgi:DNA-binding MarR family transcriptional regulator